MMNHSESIKELAAALAKAQGEMEGAPKDKKNQFGGVYADLGSVIQTAKKPLSTNGLSITQHPELIDGKVTVTSILMHLSGEWIESSISAPIGDNRALNAAQQAAIVITYLRRYSYAAIVGIYADEDTDGAAPETTRQPQRQSQPASTQTNTQPTQTNTAPVVTLPPLTKPEPINGNGHTPAPVDWIAALPVELLEELRAFHDANHVNQIKNALKSSCLDNTATPDDIRAWMRTYKSARATMTPPEAAAAVNAEWK